nr:MAG TPA: hypothetical protein [Caudoviricetes sp.]
MDVKAFVRVVLIVFVMFLYDFWTFYLVINPDKNDESWQLWLIITVTALLCVAQWAWS